MEGIIKLLGGAPIASNNFPNNVHGQVEKLLGAFGHGQVVPKAFATAQFCEAHNWGWFSLIILMNNFCP